LKSAIAKLNINPALIEDVTVGNVLLADAGYIARAAALTAGLPHTAPTQVVNRFCSSGLMALSIVANRIRAGEISVGLAVGFEDMSAT
jgi:acetyl-CoA acyltransferase 1